jgi:hypothetical protein
MQWVIQHIRHTSREGMFSGSSFATSLEVLHTIEAKYQHKSPTEPLRYPPPSSCVVATLIPEAEGRHYNS